MGDTPIFQQIADKFVEHYYNFFDTDRTALRNLYRGHSMLTFESASVAGVDAIMEKLQNLPFQQVKHEVATKVAQPSAEDGILVQITGLFQELGQDRPMSFSQSFQIKSEGDTWYVLNDIFNIVYPAHA